ncbi:coumaroyl-CoA:anthocyanidin 3-O-glucoside-6''-O-coumaroyltransferase 2-like [Bidens hawaiensis]|uniref:coumaroyl-CoA:anthocyanidin 3-O-glucoside-6''-O-coumaroyltransferase 2-like n=1 Tax=Bidens hawaiensis TaxID=980011 RepID=UPI00404A220B
MPRDIHVAHLIPLLSIQITIFNDSGYSIGLTTQHVTADERTLDKFMKHWACVCGSLSKKQDSFDAFSTRTTLSFDRRVIPNPNSLKTSFLKHWWDRSDLSVSIPPKHYYADNVMQSTFRITPSHINKIKQHILEQCKKINEDPPVHLSPYVSACAFIWICLLKVQKVQEPRDSKDGPVYLGFNAGGISRLGCEGEIPLSYFGNCIAFGRCMVIKSMLLGDYAIVFAAKSLGKEIKRLDGDVLGGADRWISDWEELDIRVLGSPKVDSYGLDFGWGKVQKVDKIGRVINVVSLSGSRDMKGGMEIGVVLSKEKMSVFSSVFNGGLMELA